MLRSTKRFVSTLVGFLLISTLLAGPMATEAEAAEVRLNVVAMGDSYTAGSGGLDYFGVSGCYKSHNSYAELMAERIGGSTIVTFENLACHGAVTSDIAGQLDELGSREKVAVDMVLLTIGGNDGGFPAVVTRCFAPALKDVARCIDEVVAAENRVSAVAADVKASLRRILDELPEARVTLVGYPYPVDDVAGCDYTLSNSAVSFKAGPAVRILADMLEVNQKRIVDELRSSYGSRISFVSTKSLFDGHENCGPKDDWLRGNFDTLIPGEWWHPNREGYTALAGHLHEIGVYKGAEDVFRYGNLPLACGFNVAYVSTYNQFGLNGITVSHGYAIDFPVGSGTTIVAAASGTARTYHSDTLGYVVDIVDENGRTHRVAHLQSGGRITDNSYVTQGTPIGLSGSTGLVTGPHLHYEQRVGGEQAPIKLDGPALEWGPNLSSIGDRKTMHSLESGNCGGQSGGGTTVTPPTSNVNRNELIFFNTSSGRRVYHSIGTDGTQTEVSSGSWSSSWDIIVPINIDGDSYNELLFYNREATSTRGKASIYDVTAAGLGKRLNSLNWSKHWTHLVPVDLDGDGRDELLVYSATKGTYYFLDISPSGSVRELSGGNWSKGWQIITAFNISGSGGDEVLLYKDGRASIYTTSTTKLATRLQSFNWSAGWTHIVPVDIEGDGRHELVIYNASSGRWYIQDVATNGGQTVLAGGSGWSKGWDHIVAVQADNNRASELLFYNSQRSSSRGVLYDMTLSGLQGPKQSYNWSSGWTFILPIQLPSR